MKKSTVKKIKHEIDEALQQGVILSPVIVLGGVCIWMFSSSKNLEKVLMSDFNMKATDFINKL